MRAELAALDGRISPAEDTYIPVTEEGFLRGDGVFEVLRVYDGVPFALSEHLDRLARSAGNLRLGTEVDRRALEADVAAVVGERGGGDHLVRIVLTRGGRRLVLTEPMIDLPPVARVAFVTYSPPRILDGIKSLSYAGNMLATRLAKERGFDEALLVTPHGRVLEAPTSSVFWVDAEGALCTPPLEDHILASITRQAVMDTVEVRECPVTTDEILGAREAFLASTVREVQALAAIEDHEMEAPGARTREAAAALRSHIEQALAACA